MHREPIVMTGARRVSPLAADPGPVESNGAQRARVRLDKIGMAFGPDADKTHAIAEISGSIRDRSFVSIIGPSGCGKSTLLDLVCGLQRPTEGAVYIDEKIVSGPRRDTAMVFQEDSTLHWRTVLENVAFGLEVNGVPKGERLDRSRRLLQLVGLGGFENHRPRQLSGGMKQRVAIARALVMEPRILLMDEPFGALDQQTRWIVGAELTKVWESASTSVLFVTHDIQEAVLLSDEVWVLSRRPSRIKKVLTIDLERPRSAELIQDPRFQAYTAELWALLSSEFAPDEGLKA